MFGREDALPRELMVELLTEPKPVVSLETGIARRFNER